MEHGFVKVAAITPEVKVADVAFNKQEICRLIGEATTKGAKILVFPELCLTGYTCGDLFLQEVLLREAKEALRELVAFTAEKDALVFVGLPYSVRGKIYDVVAVINRGELLGLVTKTCLANHGEAYEMRQFTPGPKKPDLVWFDGEEVPFGQNLLFPCSEMENLVVAAEVCEDLWAPMPPSIKLALLGATLIVNCSASAEAAGKDDYRKELIVGHSARIISGYVCANAGTGESTTDVVYGGHNIIAENGIILKESARFANNIVYSEIDVDRIVDERQKNSLFKQEEDAEDCIEVPFTLLKEKTKLTRSIECFPFVPNSIKEYKKRCKEILLIQTMGLKKRLEHTNCKSAVIGISGGLDSTLALLVTVRAFDMLGIGRNQIEAVTMPCFGTTDRTYRNACALVKKLGANLREINIKNSVNSHFSDIGQPEDKYDITFENAQARERTQVLMDIANMTGGMVIGTGDMSELVLGWATYNGDHMSMYGVNASIPKTLVRHLVRYHAENNNNPELEAILTDILDTPVSPELLPPKDGDIAQKTEEIVGSYELHDFYMYYALRFGYRPSKIYRIAQHAFAGVYDDETLLKWLKIFYKRFFAQQFKRSCLPDGPKVGSVGISPRGDLRMPSDACVAAWMRDLQELY